MPRRQLLPAHYGDTPDVVALTAPRALHLNFGDQDGGSPIEDVREGLKTIARSNGEAGLADNFTCWIEEGAGHVLSDQMWARARDTFRRHLNP